MDSVRGFNTATWRDGEIVYQLVTDLDEHDIQAILQRPSAPTVIPASLRQ